MSNVTTVNTQNSAETTTSNVSETTERHEGQFQRQGEYRPRTQNRRCVIALWKESMSDNVTNRIIQVLDAAVSFANHPEMIKALNEFREEVFGEDGKLYDTKNVDLPESGIVHVLVVNTKTGKRIAHKVFEAAEAKAYMAKVRAELEAARAAARQRHAASTSSSEFGSPISEAMKEAQKQKAANN